MCRQLIYFKLNKHLVLRLLLFYVNEQFFYKNYNNVILLFYFNLTIRAVIEKIRSSGLENVFIKNVILMSRLKM